MTIYGKLTQQNSLLLSNKKISGYKIVEYAKIPKNFDESTQYIMQKEPIEENERIFVDIEVRNLEVDEEYNE